ncbi:MAG TPA: hypothetical protein VLK85_13620 [Ramlibacter sp.]|nr:hypothetical protein [Ramlibacter sp.]
MILKPGSRWLSSVSNTEIAIVRPPKTAVVITCGGGEMLPVGSARPEPAAQAPGTTLLGKRYSDAASGLEVLCTKGGAGVLAADGRELQIKEAKALPSSD